MGAVLGYYEEGNEDLNTGERRKLLAMDLTVDHKPTLPAECARITDAGGIVREMSGEPARIFVKNQNLPGLAMSRAIGDLVAASVGVVSKPDVRMFQVQHRWLFVLICSDGVWEFITSQEAVELVGRYPSSQVHTAVEE